MKQRIEKTRSRANIGLGKCEDEGKENGKKTRNRAHLNVWMIRIAAGPSEITPPRK